MYRPNFCAECGAKIVRLEWRLWTSGRFCDVCARSRRRERWRRPLITALVLLSLGFVAGHAVRPSPPPLIILRNPDPNMLQGAANSIRDSSQQNGTRAANSLAGSEEQVYVCGARTKKGTPCSRRVHGPVRCWQHKGMPVMLPQEKLLVKN